MNELDDQVNNVHKEVKRLSEPLEKPTKKSAKMKHQSVIVLDPNPEETSYQYGLLEIYRGLSNYSANIRHFEWVFGVIITGESA